MDIDLKDVDETFRINKQGTVHQNLVSIASVQVGTHAEPRMNSLTEECSVLEPINCLTLYKNEVAPQPRRVSPNCSRQTSLIMITTVARSSREAIYPVWQPICLQAGKKIEFRAGSNG